MAYLNPDNNYEYDAYAACSFGVRFQAFDTGAGFYNMGLGGTSSTRGDEAPNDDWNSPIVTWGYGDPGYSAPPKIRRCERNYPLVAAYARCPKNWIGTFELIGGGFYTYCSPGSYAAPPGNWDIGWVPDGPSTADKSGACNACGWNPVNLHTRTKYDYAQDYTNHSPYPITIDRYFTSSGHGWHFGYDRRVMGFEMLPGDVAVAMLMREDGTQLYYRSTDADPTVDASNWTWIASQQSGSHTILSSFFVDRPANGSVSGFGLYNLRGETEIYDAQGHMVRLDGEQGLGLSFSYDAQDRATLIEDDFGRSLQISYSDPTTENTTWDNPDTSPGQPPTIDDPYQTWGSVEEVGSSQLRLPSSITDGDITISYTYDEGDTAGTTAVLSSVTQADGSTKQYVYGESGIGPTYLTGIIGEDNQRFATYTYDYSSPRKINTSTRGAGLRKVNYQYGNYVTDAYDNGFFFAFGDDYVAKPTGFGVAPCPPEACSGSGAHAKHITWDTYGNPLTITDYNDRVRTLIWDGPRALPLTITEATGTSLERTTTYTWHATKRLPLTKVEPIKIGSTTGTRTTTWTYDSDGHVTDEVVSNSINSDTREQTLTYNSLGLVETATNARGKTTEYAYDTQGNLLTIENALSQITTLSDYNIRGLPGKLVDANGLETLITYDARDRVTEMKRGSTTSGSHYETWDIAWLPINQIDTITRPDGIVYKMLYDSAHDLIEVQERSSSNVLLGKRVYTLDLMGRLTKEEAFDGSNTKIATRSQTWSTLSRLATSVGAQSQETTFTYDKDGNLTGVEDPLSHTQTSSVDALGRTVSLVDQLNKSSTLVYDVQDNLVGAVDARGASTGYAYNAFNDLLAIASPDRGTTTLAVDENGNTIETTDPRGVEAEVDYDDLDRPTSMSWSDDNVSGSPAGFTAGDKTATYAWDTCTHGIGRLCEKTDWTGTTSYSYDLWGRLTGEAFQPDGESFTLSTGYGFDNSGRPDSVVYPSGKALTYTYGSDGRPDGIQWAGNNLVEDLHYQALDGPVQGWLWSAAGIPVGKASVAFTYDLDGRMTHLSDIEETELTFDLDDRLTGTTHLTDPNLDQAYTYDDKDRLTQADNALWAHPLDYSYDDNDNRTSKMSATDGVQNSYGSTSNQLTSITPIVSGVAGTPVSVSMDAMGNIVSDGSRSFTYDATGRMVGATSGGSSAVYQVNSDGLRVRKTVSGIGAKDEIVAYDDMRRRMGVYQPNGSGGFTVKEELVYLPGDWRLIATVRGQTVGSGSSGTAYPILTDQLGSPRVILDPSSGDRRWTWEPKEAFGFQAPNQNPDSVGSFAFDGRFPGQFWDSETALFHNGYRDYDANQGRYVESDPLGLAAGWNTYGYAGGGATNSIDPFGLYLTDDTLSNNTVMSALEFMMANSPTANQIISEAMMDRRPLSIIEDPTTKFHPSGTPFFILGGIINWNSAEGLYNTCGNGYSSQSIPPALTLLHEVEHFNQSANLPEYMRNKTAYDGEFQKETKKRWTDANEWEAIQKERQVAHELGWGQRRAHSLHYPEDPWATYKTKSVFGAKKSGGAP